MATYEEQVQRSTAEFLQAVVRGFDRMVDALNGAGEAMGTLVALWAKYDRQDRTRRAVQAQRRRRHR